VLLAGGGIKFDVEAASAAATITDTILGRNESDTLLGDGSGVISGEITGVEASEKPDEGILGNSSSAKIFRERKRKVCFSLVHVDIPGSVQAAAKEFVKGLNELTF
jgi:hypothetical protein